MSRTRVSFALRWTRTRLILVLAQHYTVVPLALGQVLREYSVTELHLALNAGKWNYKSWGVPLVPNVASGAELWAWMGHTHNDTSDM